VQCSFTWFARWSNIHPNNGFRLPDFSIQCATFMDMGWKNKIRYCSLLLNFSTVFGRKRPNWLEKFDVLTTNRGMLTSKIHSWMISNHLRYQFSPGRGIWSQAAEFALYRRISRFCEFVVSAESVETTSDWRRHRLARVCGHKSGSDSDSLITSSFQ